MDVVRICVQPRCLNSSTSGGSTYIDHCDLDVITTPSGCMRPGRCTNKNKRHGPCRWYLFPVLWSSHRTLQSLPSIGASGFDGDQLSTNDITASASMLSSVPSWKSKQIRRTKPEYISFQMVYSGWKVPCTKGTTSHFPRFEHEGSCTMMAGMFAIKHPCLGFSIQTTQRACVPFAHSPM